MALQRRRALRELKLHAALASTRSQKVSLRAARLPLRKQLYYVRKLQHEAEVEAERYGRSRVRRAKR